MAATERTTATVEERVLALYREHGRQLYGYTLGILGQPADAEDVVQDTFLRLAGHLSRGGDDGHLRGWLFRVATNLCRDVQRGRSRRAAAPEERGHAGSSALHSIAIERTLNKLAPRERELVGLRGLGLTYAEIAVALELRPSSVGTLLARAVARFTETYHHEMGLEGMTDDLSER